MISPCRMTIFEPRASPRSMSCAQSTGLTFPTPAVSTKASPSRDARAVPQLSEGHLTFSGAARARRTQRQHLVPVAYEDAATVDGFRYAYRAGEIDQADNRVLRAAYELRVPLVYFVGTRPGWYRPEWPTYVTYDDPVGRWVTLTPGRMVGPYDEREAVLPGDDIERRYAVRETRVRLHQMRFRARVLPAYANRCTICRLKETRLLDAAHIIGDADPGGKPAISNGLSLCSIHHRALDEDLIGVSPDYLVAVHPRLREEEDGPMLNVLKEAHGAEIDVPRRREWRPDRELLAVRYERFQATG